MTISPDSAPTTRAPASDADVVTLAAPHGGRAEVRAHGAHVTSWTPGGDAGRAGERIFLSSRARYDAGSAIRGGIPVIFPQFSDMGRLPKHGFARVRRWTLVSAAPDGSCAVLALEDDATTRDVWPYRFRAEVSVSLPDAGTMTVDLAVRNVGDASFGFTAALHTYLRVADVAEVSIRGLDGLAYLDQTTGATVVAAAEPVRVIGEVDRIYRAVPGDVVVERVAPTMDVRVRARGFADAVVWNPGPAKAALLDDLGAGEWQRFVCVESATVTVPVTVAPDEEWRGSQTLIVAPR